MESKESEMGAHDRGGGLQGEQKLIFSQVIPI